MKCQTLSLDGIVAIVCTSGRPRRAILKCKCGNHATRLCDWLLPGGGTCSKAVCDDCRTVPGPGKDLCADHAAEWRVHPSNPQRQLLPESNNDDKTQFPVTSEEEAFARRDEGPEDARGSDAGHGSH